MKTNLTRALGGNSSNPTHLLDEFAKAALTGLLASDTKGSWADFSNAAYDIAADMVQARLRMLQELAVRAGFTLIEPGKPIPLPVMTRVELLVESGYVASGFVQPGGRAEKDVLAYREVVKPKAGA